VFAAAEAPARLSHLVGSGDAPRPVSAVLSRWLLPAGVPVPPARVLRCPPAEELERALVAQLTEALARVQAHEESVAQVDPCVGGNPQAGTESSP
jgi:alkylated DNA nucleotide flippase Atl1